MKDRNIVIKVENLSKEYRLGELGTGSISRDLNAIWAKFRGKENPNSQINFTMNQNSDNGFHRALTNISFDVYEGDVLGIIGKNGAGKSTLLKILSRVTSPTSGQFKVKGRIASLLEVGTGFHPDLTGRENIFLNGAILGMRKSEINSKFDEIVDFSGVEKFIDTPVKRYSSGMYVRLAFAVAAHLEPEILIVDEVLAVGDMEFQKKCLGKMKDVSQQGRTVLFVSHNMNAMQQLCNTGILIEEGKLQMSGNINDVVNHYINSTKLDSTQNVYLSRKGTGDVLYKNYFLSDVDGNRISDIMMGDDLYINFTLKNIRDVKGLEISFTIFNSMGEAISHIQNMDDNFPIPDKHDLISMKIKLNAILFVPGTYFISVWAGCSGEAYDHIEKCMYFELTNNPDYNRLIYPHNVKSFLNSKWEVTN